MRGNDYKTPALHMGVYVAALRALSHTHTDPLVVGIGDGCPPERRQIGRIPGLLDAEDYVSLVVQELAVQLLDLVRQHPAGLVRSVAPVPGQIDDLHVHAHVGLDPNIDRKLGNIHTETVVRVPHDLHDLLGRPAQST